MIENDIGWRIDAMIDFLVGRSFQIKSAAPDEARRGQIESLLDRIIQHNGGANFFAQMALLGAVYGFVDVLVKLDADELQRYRSASQLTIDADPPASPGDSHGEGESPLPTAESAPRSRRDVRADDLDIARLVRLEIVEPARALPLLSDSDWRKALAYVQVYQLPRASSETKPARDGFLSRLGASAGRLFRNDARRERVTFTEVITPDAWHRYEDQTLVASGGNSLGEIPLVHIQNLALPFSYAGVSDVEPLIPVQDELNTRLSDRANRITLQSFKMYLGKGIDGFTDLPIAPGRMWSTDNQDAQILEFGGDSANPSEDRHITELREAMDKLSGVTPIAAGAIRGRIGNLTSAAALRVTMMALLAKTQRKRITYGAGISRMCELALAWLDRAGVFETSAVERQVQIEFPDPISQLFET